MKLVEQLKKLLVPKDDDLHVDWIRKFNVKTQKAEGPRIYIAVCKCGGKHLLKAENGIRCQDCGAFHTHESFVKVMIKAKKYTTQRNIDNRILKVFNHEKSTSNN